MFCPTLQTSLRVIRGISSLHLKGVTKLLVRTNNVCENRRSIFSDEYLDMDAFNKASKHIRFTCADDAAFKASMVATYEKSGLHSVFTEDIIKLNNLATSDADFDFLQKILVETMRDEVRSFSAFKPLSFFFMRCLAALKVDQAKQVWNNPDVQKSGLLSPSNLSLKYLCLLYRVEEYDELVKTYSTLSEVKLTHSTVVMAALTKIGTKEAFVLASEIMRKPPVSREVKSSTSGGRVTALYAYFAYRIGHVGLAFDTLTDHRRVNRPSKITSNLKLMILTDVGRLKDALLVIRSELLPSRDSIQQSTNTNTGSKSYEKVEIALGSKKIVCMEVMKKLTNAIREQYDPELSSELTSLCKALDTSAYLSENSLETMIFEQIARKDLSLRNKKHSNNHPVQDRNERKTD